jgi:hypothetical protein
MLRKSLLVFTVAIGTIVWGMLPTVAQTTEQEGAQPPREEVQGREARGRFAQGRGERGGRLRARWGAADRQLLGMIPLLQVESVQRELASSEDETTKIETLTVQIREDFSEEIREVMQSFRESDPDERQNLRTRIADVRQLVNERLAASLSGEQFQRLNQIDLQLGMRRNGAMALTSEEIAEALDLTSEQQEQLRTKAREIRRQVADEGLPTLDTAREQVSDVLTSAQMEKLDTLLGTEFDLPAAMLENDARGQRGFRRQGGDRGDRPLRPRDGGPREDAPEAPPFEDELTL